MVYNFGNNVGAGNKMSMFVFKAINIDGILRTEDLFATLFGFSVQKVFLIFNGFSTIVGAMFSDNFASFELENFAILGNGVQSLLGFNGHCVVGRGERLGKCGIKKYYKS